MSEATFIGIDLAWRGRNPSGGCVLTGDRRRARLVNVDASLASCSAVLTYIDNHAAASTYVAIDAPLIIRNETGQRPCETLIGKRYGARHASCHSSNLLLYPNALGVDLASQLISRGYKHALDGTRTENERVILEVYPHPALLELFGLRTIIKYKNTKVAVRRSGQQEVQRRLSGLSHSIPPLEPTPELSQYLGVDTNSLRGSDLKANEDGLDAIVCAYIAYYFWFWGSTRTHMFGDLDSGYIIVPKSSQDP
jgi:predicted RNase H-like nuclease